MGVMRFCQALITELYRHLGPDTDIPAGDMGVGAREVGFMAGMMKKLFNSNDSVFTGKGPWHIPMRNIHENCVRYGRGRDKQINYLDGANIAGFVKVADAMLEQGVY